MLRSGDKEKIARTIEQLKAEAKGVIDELIKLSWYMRGSLQYKDAFNLCFAERQMIDKFINQHLEAIKKHPFPIY